MPQPPDGADQPAASRRCGSCAIPAPARWRWRRDSKNQYLPERVRRSVPSGCGKERSIDPPELSGKLRQLERAAQALVSVPHPEKPRQRRPQRRPTQIHTSSPEGLKTSVKLSFNLRPKSIGSFRHPSKVVTILPPGAVQYPVERPCQTE